MDFRLFMPIESYIKIKEGRYEKDENVTREDTLVMNVVWKNEDLIRNEFIENLEKNRDFIVLDDAIKKTIIKILTVDIMDKNTTFKKLFVLGKRGIFEHHQHKLQTENSKYCLSINYLYHRLSNPRFNTPRVSSTFIHIEIGKLDYVIKIDENCFDVIFYVEDLIK